MDATLTIPPLWPHQARALPEILAAIQAGSDPVCVTCPTGGGKTRLIAEVCRWAHAETRKVVVYTQRKLLTAQSSGVLTKHGIAHGVMAAGYDPALLRDIQIASLQTVDSRVLKRGKWELHQAEVVIVDECHQAKSDTALEIINKHRAAGSVIVGFTATPIGIGSIYKRLIVAGKNSELRSIGALVRADTFAPDEPQLAHVRKIKISEGENRKAIFVQGVFGRIYKNWKLLENGWPTILFAPCVKSSLWCVRQFERQGIHAAHIDATTPDEERQQIIHDFASGIIRVLCNRFVLREGVDIPVASHVIFACVFGGLTAYLQAGGRVLRAAPGKEKAVVQDHGGNAWRHGSLNEDRVFEIKDTDLSIAKAKYELRKDGKESEPITCPECGGVRRTGSKCPYCGHEHVRSVRHVVQADGTLKRCVGSVVKRRQPVSEDQKTWNACYFASLHKGTRTMRQIGADYKRRTGKWPSPALRFVPGSDADWDLRIKDFHNTNTRKEASPHAYQ